MATTLKCKDCDTIHAIQCPKCKSGNQRVMGTLDLGLIGVNVQIGLAEGALGQVLYIQKPSGQVIVPLDENDMHTQLKLEL